MKYLIVALALIAALAGPAFADPPGPGGGGVIGITGGDPLLFNPDEDGDVEMTINSCSANHPGLYVDSTCRVGIRTDSPEALLDVRGAGGVNSFFRVSTFDATRFEVDSDGNVSVPLALYIGPVVSLIFSSPKINATGGLGTDKEGADLFLAGGKGTGDGDGGDIFFQTSIPGVSGDTLQGLATMMTITLGGRVGIGTTTPEQPLDILVDEGVTAAVQLGDAANNWRMRVPGSGPTDGWWELRKGMDDVVIPFRVSDVAATDLLLVGASDASTEDADQVTISGIFSITPIGTAPATCSIGHHYVDTSGAYCGCTSPNTWSNMVSVGSCV